MTPSSGLVLIDSSIWMRVWRPEPELSSLRRRVRELVHADMAATMGVVRLEVLRGTRDDADYRARLATLAGMHQIPVTEATWTAAGLLGHQLRRRGVTVPSTDLAIAATAIVAGATLMHRDAHYDTIAQHAPLQVESHL